MRDLDRFRGCLIGGAAGDALGYAVGFLHENRIFSRYGEKGITEYDLQDGVGEISDDTQMTLFTAAGLLSAATRNRLDGKTEPFAEYIRRSYLDWKRTQVEGYPLKSGPRYSWLTGVQGLFDRRAPGNTCMSAMGDGGRGTVERPVNRSKGCGGVMRVAPVGLYFNDRGTDVREIAYIGAQAAAITHGHEISMQACVIYVHVARRLLAGETIREIIPTLKFAKPFDRLDKIDQLSEEKISSGGFVVHTLEASLWVLAKYDSFKDTVLAAVNLGDDTDTTGAVAGGLAGIVYGLESDFAKECMEVLRSKEMIAECL